MRTKRKQNKKSKSALDVDQLKKLVGQTRLLQHSDIDIAFPVIVKSVALVGCSVKATVEPLDGVGDTEVCVTDLMTREEAIKWQEHNTTSEMIDQLIHEVTGKYYATERRAAFALFLEKYPDQEEVAKINENLALDGKSPKRVGDSFIREEMRRLLELQYKHAPREEEYD